MLGLLRGLETAIVFPQAMPEENRMQAKIVLFAYNKSSSVAAITSERPGSSQRTSQKFVEATRHFLHENREANIITTLANLFRQIRDSMKLEWVSEWASKPMTVRYAIADRIPPSSTGSHAFRTLNRHILGVITQARTGHGGEYYQTHNIQEPTTCPCNEELQTREHI